MSENRLRWESAAVSLSADLPSYPECIEEGCERAVYEDQRCKRHRDEHWWRTTKGERPATPKPPPGPGIAAFDRRGKHYSWCRCIDCLRP